MKFIEFKNVSNGFLESISFTLKDGCWLSIVGEKGSGKTSILHIITNFHTHTKGEIGIYDSNFGFVFENMPTIQNMKVKEFLDLIKVFYITDALEIIEILHLKSILNKFLNDLDQSEKKRISIFFALVKKPNYLIMDEPTAHLESQIKDKLWAFLKSNYKTILFTTSNWDEATNYGEEVLILSKGKILAYDKKFNLLNRLRYKKKVVVEVRNRIPEVDFGSIKFIKNGFLHVYLDEKETISSLISNGYQIKNTNLEDVFFALNDGYELLYS